MAEIDRVEQMRELLLHHLTENDFQGAASICARLERYLPGQGYGDYGRWILALYHAYHFDFPECVTALKDMVERGLLSAWTLSSDFSNWVYLSEPSLDHEFDQAVLRELAHQMEINLRADDYGAFLTRLYRFREVLMHLLVLSGEGDAGVPYWRMGRASQNLSTIAKLLLAGRLQRFYGAYFYLKSRQLSDTIELRNHSIIGHGRLGFSNDRLWLSYDGYGKSGAGAKHIEHFISDMRLLFKDLGHEMGANPYDGLRSLLVQRLSQLSYVRPFSRVHPPVTSGLNVDVFFADYLTIYDYRAILRMAERGWMPMLLGNLADVGRRLLWSNLSAQDAELLAKVQAQYVLWRQRQRRSVELLPHDWKALADGEQGSVVSLLYWQLQAFDARHDYGEWLVRAYRLMEELLWVYFGLDVDTQSLQLCVKNSPFGARVILEGTDKHHAMLHLLLPKLVEQGGPHTPTDTAYTLLSANWIAALVQLRTDSIIGHGAHPVTKEIIELRCLSLSDLHAQIRQVMEVLGIPLVPDYFAALERLLLYKKEVEGTNHKNA